MEIGIVTTVGTISARFHQEYEDLVEGSYREQKQVRIEIMAAVGTGKSDLIDRLYRQQTTPTQPRISYGISNMQIPAEIGTPWLMQQCEGNATYQRQNDLSPYQGVDLPQTIPKQVRNKEEYQSIEAKISAIEKLGCQATPEQRQMARELSLLIQQYEDNWISQSSFALVKADELPFWKRINEEIEEILELLRPQSPNGHLGSLRAFHLQSFYSKANILNESYICDAILLHDEGEISSLPAWGKPTCYNIMREFQLMREFQQGQQRPQPLDDYLLELQISVLENPYFPEESINTNLNTGRLRSIRLRRAKKSGAQIKGAKLDGTNLRGTDVNLVDIPGLGFTFNGADLDTTGNMKGTRFECDLRIDEVMRENLHDRDTQEGKIGNLYGAMLSKINANECTDENEMNQPNSQAGIPEWDNFCKDFAELLNPNHPSAVSLAYYIRRNLRQFKLFSITEFDVLTEVFLRAYKLVILGCGVVIRYPAAWVRRTAFNYIRELRREQKQLIPLEIDIAYESLKRALQEFDPNEQRLLPLKLIDSLVNGDTILFVLVGEGKTVDAFGKQKERALNIAHKSTSKQIRELRREQKQLIPLEIDIAYESLKRALQEFDPNEQRLLPLKLIDSLVNGDTILFVLVGEGKTVDAFGKQKERALNIAHKSTSKQIQVELGTLWLMQQCEGNATYQQQNDLSPYQGVDLPQAIPKQVRNKEEYQSIEAKISAIEKLGCQATPEQRQMARELSLLIQQYEERMVKNWLESCKFEMN